MNTDVYMKYHRKKLDVELPSYWTDAATSVGIFFMFFFSAPSIQSVFVSGSNGAKKRFQTKDVFFLKRNENMFSEFVGL